MGKKLAKWPGNAHPWDEWLNGKIWLLTQGKDFQGKPTTLRDLAYHHAHRCGFAVRVTLVENDKIILEARHDQPSRRTFDRTEYDRRRHRESYTPKPKPKPKPKHKPYDYRDYWP